MTHDSTWHCALYVTVMPNVMVTRCTSPIARTTSLQGTSRRHVIVTNYARYVEVTIT